MPNHNIVLLRHAGMGNNCHHVADNFPGGKIRIVEPDTVPKNAEWVIRWGTTTLLPNPKTKVLNKAKAINETFNKGVFRKKLADNGLASRTWLSLGAFRADPYICDKGVIVRPVHHQRGNNLHFALYDEEVEAAVNKCIGEGGYYISEFIKKDEEYRVFISQGRVVTVWSKHPRRKSDISWGCVSQGEFHYVNWGAWPLAVCENAIKSFNLSRLDFGAVDVMVKNGVPYCLEINTAPEVWPYYGKRLGECLKWAIENNPDRETIKCQGYDDWKKIIHPALSVKAVV